MISVFGIEKSAMLLSLMVALSQKSFALSFTSLQNVQRPTVSMELASNLMGTPFSLKMNDVRMYPHSDALRYRNSPLRRMPTRIAMSESAVLEEPEQQKKSFADKVR